MDLARRVYSRDLKIAAMREIDGGRPIGEVARIKFRSVVQFLLYMGTKRDLRIPCSRETMQSIRESVHQLLEDQITRLGLQRFLRGSEGRDYRPAYETSFTFHSLRDQTAHNIKSTEGANVLWVEEAQSVSKKSWRTVIPTIRKPGSEIWISFNPELETDETYRRFMVSSRAGCCRSEVEIGDRCSPPSGLRVPKPIEDSTGSWTLLNLARSGRQHGRTRETG